MKDWKDLKRFAEHCGFFVTSTTGGKHNVGSKHFRGLAIDVRTRDKTNAQIESFMRKCSAIGVWCFDERTRPKNQKVWGGAHLHLEVKPNTSGIVREFQRKNNLQIDGIVGPKTLAALDTIN